LGGAKRRHLSDAIPDGQEAGRFSLEKWRKGGVRIGVSEEPAARDVKDGKMRSCPRLSPKCSLKQEQNNRNSPSRKGLALEIELDNVGSPIDIETKLRVDANGQVAWSPSASWRREPGYPFAPEESLVSANAIGIAYDLVSVREHRRDPVKVTLVLGAGSMETHNAFSKWSPEVEGGLVHATPLDGFHFG
jgi:hypothetical protein